MGTPRAVRCRSMSRAIRTYWVKTSTPAPSARIVSSSSSSSSTLPERPSVRGSSSLRYCAGWLQICFSAVSSFTTRPRRAKPSEAEISASVSRTTASYRPVCSLVSDTARSVSVFGGSSGAMPGSDLRLRSRNGATSRESRSAAAGSFPPSTACA